MRNLDVRAESTDSSVEKKQNPGPQVSSPVNRAAQLSASIYPKSTHASYGDKVPLTPPAGSDSLLPNHRRVSERTQSLAWFAKSMLVFSVLIGLALTINSGDFQNYQLPHSFQPINYGVALVLFASAATLLACKNVRMAKVILRTVLVMYVLSLFEAAHATLGNLTFVLTSPSAGSLMGLYILLNIGFVIGTWSIMSEIEELPE